MPLIKLCEYNVSWLKSLIFPRDILQLSNFSLFFLDFTPALLLLVLTCPLWQISQSVPLMGMQDSCVLYARTLLQNITDVLNQVGLQRMQIHNFFFLTVYILLNITCPQTENPV